MRRTVIGLVAALAFAAQALSQEHSVISVYAQDDASFLDARSELTLKFWLQQLMLSALYSNVVQDASLEEWHRGTSAPTRILVSYPKVASLAIPEKQTLTFTEVLLPLPPDRYPDYIFMKQGRRVQRLGKYDPWVLHKLVSEAHLPLYGNLSDVERTLF